MRADNSSHIIQAAKDRHDKTLQHARAALQRLDRAGEPISFRTVAEAAQVSRSWLYRDQALRTEIERLRAAQPPSTHIRLPSAQQASVESLQRRLEDARDELRRVRNENTALRDQVARLFGQRRSGHTLDRPVATTIEPDAPRERHVANERTRSNTGSPASRSR